MTLLASFTDELTKLSADLTHLTPKSSNIRGFRYDPKSKQMFVTFKGGSTYRYDGVGPGAYRAMKRNKSTGRSVNKHLKAGGFEYEKVAVSDRWVADKVHAGILAAIESGDHRAERIIGLHRKAIDPSIGWSTRRKFGIALNSALKAQAGEAVHAHYKAGIPPTDRKLVGSWAPDYVQPKSVSSTKKKLPRGKLLAGGLGLLGAAALAKYLHSRSKEKVAGSMKKELFGKMTKKAAGGYVLSEYTKKGDNDSDRDVQRIDVHLKGKNVGFQTYHPGSDGDYVWVKSLYVDPKHRGKGVAKMLLDEVERKNKGKEMRLRARPFRDKNVSAEGLKEMYGRRGYVQYDKNNRMMKKADMTKEAGGFEYEKVAVSEEWVRKMMHAGLLGKSEQEFDDIGVRMFNKARVAHRAAAGLGSKSLPGGGFSDIPLLKDTPKSRAANARIARLYDAAEEVVGKHQIHDVRPSLEYSLQKGYGSPKKPEPKKAVVKDAPKKSSAPKSKPSTSRKLPRGKFVAGGLGLLGTAALAKYLHSRGQEKTAGAVKKQVTYDGLPMKIEHEAGDKRRGILGATGEKWERTMHDAYGYVPGTNGQGADGEAIDVYFNPRAPDEPPAHVYKIRQKKKTGEFDEDKFMVGYTSASDARKAFSRNMPSWAFGSMTRLSTKKFKSQVGHTKEALSPAYIQAAARSAARKGGRPRAYEAMRRMVDRGVFRDVGGIGRQRTPWKMRHSLGDANRLIEKEKAIGIGLDQGLNYSRYLGEKAVPYALGALGITGAGALIHAMGKRPGELQLVEPQRETTL